MKTKLGISPLFVASIAITVVAVFVLILILSSFVIADQTTLIYSNGSQVDQVHFDPNATMAIAGFDPALNFTTGSGSYFDRSLVNPDIYATVCHPNLEVNSTVDFVYKTFSGNIVRSVLNLPLLVTSITTENISNQTVNCATLDVQFSASSSLYPGYVTPLLTTGGVKYFLSDQIISLNNTPTFNGAITYNLTVDDPPKSYWFYVPLIRDDNGNQITANRSLLLTSLVSASNVTILEKVLRPYEILNYSGTFSGGERYIVNGIDVLNISLFVPCGEISQTGYYLLNNSMYGLNSSCLNVSDATDVKVNFAGELFDGDASANGSMAAGVCPVNIRNSQNVTIEGLSTQQFYSGICIDNSTVTIFGTDLVDNLEGMRISNNSRVYVVLTSFNNQNIELNVTDNSTAVFLNNSFVTAKSTGIYHDNWINDVRVRPVLPTIPGFSNIEQFLEVGRNGNDSWAQVGFNYDEPLPNNVETDQVFVFKYNGSYVTITTTDNTTNVSTTFQTWTAANWTQQFTLVSPQQHLIYIPNISSFSVFAPFGKIITNGVGAGPVSVPHAGGSAGSGGGGSGGGIAGGPLPSTPAANATTLLELNLIIPDNVTIMQGDIGNVPFTLQDVGTAPANGVSVLADVPRGWKSSTTTIDSIYPGESIDNQFSLATYENAIPADYYVPVSAIINGNVIVTRILKVVVVPRGNLSRLLVTQYDPIINLLPNSQKDITFTAKNIGDFPLQNVQILLEPNDCIKQVIGSYDFAYGEEKQVTYKFVSGNSADCKYTLKFVQGDKLVDFVPVTFQVRQLSFIDQTIKLLLVGLIVGVWFVVGIVIVIKRRRPPFQNPPSSGFGGIGGSNSSFGETYSSPLAEYSKYYRGK